MISHPTQSLESSKAKLLARRYFLAYFSGLGLSSTLLPGVLWAKMQEERNPAITQEMMVSAEKLAGLEFTDPERESMVAGVNQNLQRYQELRHIPLGNSDWPSLQFKPALPDMNLDTERQPFKMSLPITRAAPANLEDVAFWPVTDLAQLVRSRKVRSLDLTRMYLERLKKYDPLLQCVITLTEDLALRQAQAADREIGAGRYRGPLHGIPWGAKDLLAARQYKTTWGAAPYKDQVLDHDATIVERLEEAGAVLVAKLSTGELAAGDIWFGGQTKNPWNLQEGTMGSSAGPAAATAAGLVGFSIGTETRGSIVFPSTRCGVTGLRPTFGRVSRYGVMAISLSMDKPGPMCRSVEDCALVFDAIYGPDGKDGALVDLPFNWDPELDITQLRVGYIRSAFDEERDSALWMANDQTTLATLRSLGLDLRPVEFPDYPVDVGRILLDAEEAAVFDELTRSRRAELLARPEFWPRRFRVSRMIPAVEYIQCDRIRTLLMKEMAQLMNEVDVVVAPPSAPGTSSNSPLGKNIPLTNLTGHPCVVLPNGFTEKGTPSTITLVGKLYAEAEILALAKHYQDATGFHLRHPEINI